MGRAILLMSACAVALTAGPAAAERQERTLFERNHDAIERAERRGDVGDRPTREQQDRGRPEAERGLINRSERQQMQRLENSPENR